MKLVREYINEKFSEGGDPVRQMGIGLKTLLKEFEIVKVLDYLPKESSEVIAQLFGESLEDLYYLGNSEYSKNIFHRRELKKLLKDKKPIRKFKAHFKETPADDIHEEYFELYDTSVGKIMKMYDVGYSPAYSSTAEDAEVTYIGDLEAAGNLDILNKQELLVF